MLRNPESHKGENGSVAVIGGSVHQHGAPLFSALAAEASGVDLVYVWVPVCHREVGKAASLNFQVYPFGSESSDELSPADRTRIVEFLATIDAAVIGPGLSRTPKNVASVLDLLEAAACPLVVDASALQKDTLKRVAGKHAVLTPHLGELERMGLSKADVPALCSKHACTMLLKGPADLVVSDTGHITEVTGGNAGLTVGGTGDTLAGLVAGLLAQGASPVDACRIASETVKRSGDALQKDYGFAYGTRRVIERIPSTVASLSRS